MKKCILCMVLLCFALAACATVTNQPATEPQMNVTTTVPQGNGQSASTHIPTTNRGYPPCLNGGHVYEDGICKYCKKPANIVRIVSGEQSIAPVGGILVKKTYDNGQWPTAIYPPLQFASYVDSQIPSIQLVGSVQLQMAENVELKGAWMQRYPIGEQTAITLQQLTELAPDTYYIGIALVQKDHFVADDWETTTFQFGFKLIVPDMVIPTTAPTTKPTTKPTTQPTTKPTTKPTTVPTTVPVTAPSFPAGTVTVGNGERVEVVAGHQTVVPLFGFLWSEYYVPETNGWRCGDGMGIRFDRCDEQQIPVIRLTGSVNIHLPQSYEFGRIQLQTEKNGKAEDTTVGALSGLAPGTYYVKFSTIRYGQVYDGKQERYSAQYGFKLVVPETATLRYPTVTATWPKLPVAPTASATATTTPTSPAVKPDGSPFSHVPVPQSYTLRQVGDKYYIDFGPGENKRYPLDHGCLRYPNALGYGTMEQMYQTMLTGDFSAQDLQIIRAVFPLDPEYGFELPNPHDPHELTMPDVVNFKRATLSSRGLVVRFGTPDDTPEEQIIKGYLEFLGEDEFNRRVDAKFNNFYWDDREFDFTAVAVPERNATAYDARIRSDGRMLRILVYSYQYGDRKVYVYEQYFYDEGDDLSKVLTDPYTINMFVDDNGKYYQVFFEKTSFTPTVDWLMEFEWVPMK